MNPVEDKLNYVPAGKKHQRERYELVEKRFCIPMNLQGNDDGRTKTHITVRSL